MKKSKPDVILGDQSEANPVGQFENALKELEQVVAQLEQGEQSLESSLQSFERGVALYRQCQSALESAEIRVNQLLDPNDPSSATPFAVEQK